MTGTRRVQTWIVSSCHASHTQIHATYFYLNHGCNKMPWVYVACQFDSDTGLATHKRACKAKITAAASKLLEACKVNLERKAEFKCPQDDGCESNELDGDLESARR